MASSSRGKNLEEAYANLSLNNDDEEGLILEGVPEATNTEGLNRCLVGRFVTNKKVNFMAMQDTLASIWRPVKGVFMEETDRMNMFLFKFFHDRDMQRVLDDGPWTFNQQVLLIKKFNMDEQLKDVKLSVLSMWIQVYDVPIGFKSEFILKSIGNFVGCFLESDPRNFQGMCRNYLRIRVAIDIDRPLKRRMKIKKPGGEWLWIQFKYERLPSFCFYCGRIGHAEKFCEEMFDNSQNNEMRRYDSSLRAPLRGQELSKANQWLRGANGAALAPVKLDDKEEDGGGMEAQTVEESGIDASENHNSEKSGISEIMCEIRGGDQGKVVTEMEPKNMIHSNERREINIAGNDTAGLLISDPKRRRIDGLEECGPIIDNTVEEIAMREAHTSESENQKNMLGAGTARQSRLGL